MAQCVLPLLLLLLPPLASASAQDQEPTDASCSLNGRVVGGLCECDVAWSGPACELLALLPSPPGADYDVRESHGTSTWGASIVELPHEPGTWHMYFSEFLEVHRWPHAAAVCAAPRQPR